MAELLVITGLIIPLLPLYTMDDCYSLFVCFFINKCTNRILNNTKWFFVKGPGELKRRVDSLEKLQKMTYDGWLIFDDLDVGVKYSKSVSIDPTKDILPIPLTSLTLPTHEARPAPLFLSYIF